MIKLYAEERDKAIKETWDKNSLEPFTKFIQKNQHLYPIGYLNQWNTVNDRIKWMTVCKTTLQITSESLKPYQERASEKLDQLRSC